MNENGSTVFYLPRLDNAELGHALRLALQVYDHAPRLCGALVDALTDEQTRRLRGGQVETELLTLPCHRWTSGELREALTLVTVLSYAERSYAVGQLIDGLVRVLVAAVAARMARLEEACAR